MTVLANGWDTTQGRFLSTGENPNYSNAANQQQAQNTQQANQAYYQQTGANTASRVPGTTENLSGNNYGPASTDWHATGQGSANPFGAPLAQQSGYQGIQYSPQQQLALANNGGNTAGFRPQGPSPQHPFSGVGAPASGGQHLATGGGQHIANTPAPYQSPSQLRGNNGAYNGGQPALTQADLSNARQYSQSLQHATGGMSPGFQNGVLNRPGGTGPIPVGGMGGAPVGGGVAVGGPHTNGFVNNPGGMTGAPLGGSPGGVGIQTGQLNRPGITQMPIGQPAYGGAGPRPAAPPAYNPHDTPFNYQGSAAGYGSMGGTPPPRPPAAATPMTSFGGLQNAYRR